MYDNILVTLLSAEQVLLLLMLNKTFDFDRMLHQIKSHFNTMYTICGHTLSAMVSQCIDIQ